MKRLAILLLALALFPLTAHAAHHRAHHVSFPLRGVYSVTINNTQKMPVSCGAIAPPNPTTGYPVSWWPNTAPVFTSDNASVTLAPISGGSNQVWAIPKSGFVGTANITCSYTNPDGKVATPSSGQIIVAGAPAPTPEPSPSASPAPTAIPSAKPSPDITGTGISFCGPSGCNPVAQ